MIIQRPYGIIANPEITPKAVFISTFDTAPLGSGLRIGTEKRREKSSGRYRLSEKNQRKRCKYRSERRHNHEFRFTRLKNTVITYFDGPHPAGNVGIQINHVNPINKGEHVWTVNIQDLAIIGRLFTEGYFDAQKIIALTGSEVKKPIYYHTILGAKVACLTEGKPEKSGAPAYHFRKRIDRREGYF